MDRIHDRRVSERRQAAKVSKKADRELVKIAAMLEVAIDGRDKTHTALKQSEARYRALFQATKECVMIVDDDFVIVEANPSMCQLLKTTLGRIVGHPMAEFFPPELRDPSRMAFEEFKNKGYWEGPWPVRALDGTIISMEWRATAHFIPGYHFTIGHPLREVGIPPLTTN